MSFGKFNDKIMRSYDHVRGDLEHLFTKHLYLVIALALIITGSIYYFATRVPAAPEGEPALDKTGWITNGTVYAIKQGNDGTTYLGGDFDYVGPNTGLGVAACTSINCTSIGSITDETSADYNRLFHLESNPGIFAVVPDENGGWYVGGKFMNDSGTEINNLVHILSTGAIDSSFNFTMNGKVNALALSPLSNTLYVGGEFTMIGGQQRNGVAAINLENNIVTPWDPKLSSINGSLVFIKAIKVSFNGLQIYLGGSFDLADGQARKNIVRVISDGSVDLSWAPQITSSSTDASVNALALDVFGKGEEVTGHTVLYVGGSFDGIEDSDGLKSRVNLGAISTNLGNFVQDWQPDTNAAVNALVYDSANHRVYVGGEFTEIDNISEDPSPNSSDPYLAALSADTTLADPMFPTEETLSIFWGGSFDASVKSLALSPNNDYIAVGGDFANLDQGFTIYPRRHLVFLGTDGTLYDENNSFSISADGAVNALSIAEVSGNDNTFIGTSGVSIGGEDRKNLAAFEPLYGSSLGALSEAWKPSANDKVLALAVTDNNVYVGGEFTTLTSTDGVNEHIANYLGRISRVLGNDDVDDWGMVPNQENNEVKALDIDLIDNKLYVGGSFTVPRNYLTRYDLGTDSSAFGIPPSLDAWDPAPNNIVHAVKINKNLSFQGGNPVYIGGEFTEVGIGKGDIGHNVSQKYFATVDSLSGNSIAPVDRGLSNDGFVRAIDFDKNKVYIGGDFTAVGGNTRNHLAAFNIWSFPLDLDWNPNANGSVSAIKVIGNSVYAGGAFNTIGDTMHPLIARLNTTTGAATNWVDGFFGDNNPTVYAIAGRQTFALPIVTTELHFGGKYPVFIANSENITSMQFRHNYSRFKMEEAQTIPTPPDWQWVNQADVVQNVGEATLYGVAYDNSDTNNPKIYSIGTFAREIDYINASGNKKTLISNGNSSDIFVAKQDRFGNVEWVRKYGGDKDDFFDTRINTSLGIAVAPDGNSLYISGSLSDSSSSDDPVGEFNFDPDGGNIKLTLAPSASKTFQKEAFIAKLDSSGKAIWVRTIMGGMDEYYSRLALDPSGNVYATGFFSEEAEGVGAVVKNSNSTTLDLVNDISLSGSNPDDLDALVVKYDPDGKLLWANEIIGNELGFSTLGFGIAASADKVLVTGILDEKESFLYTYGVDGYIDNTNQFGDSSVTRKDFGVAVTIGKTNSDIAYIVGSFAGTAVFFGDDTLTANDASKGDGFILKYNILDDNIEWARRSGATIHDYYTGVSTDNAGNVYTSGFVGDDATFDGFDFPVDTTGLADIAVVKYDSSGNFKWVKTSGSIGDDFGYGIASAPDEDTLYITGAFTDPATPIVFDSAILHLDQGTSSKRDGFTGRLSPVETPQLPPQQPPEQPISGGSSGGFLRPTPPLKESTPQETEELGVCGSFINTFSAGAINFTENTENISGANGSYCAIGSEFVSGSFSSQGSSWSWWCKKDIESECSVKKRASLTLHTDKITIIEGETATLNWFGGNIDFSTCSVFPTPSILDKNNKIAKVSPSQNTIYTLTCKKDFAAAVLTDSVTINVTPAETICIYSGGILVTEDPSCEEDLDGAPLDGEPVLNEIAVCFAGDLGCGGLESDFGEIEVCFAGDPDCGDSKFGDNGDSDEAPSNGTPVQGGGGSGGSGGGGIIDKINAVTPAIVDAWTNFTNALGEPGGKAGKAGAVGFALAGLVAGAVASAFSILGSLTSLSELAFLLARIWQLAAGLVVPPPKITGVVHDGHLGPPLDPAVVYLLDEAGNPVKQALTNLDGQYSFHVDPSKSYQLMVQKTDYVHPDPDFVGQDHDEFYKDLYQGGNISVTSDNPIIHKNIGMHHAVLGGLSWNERAKIEQGLMKKPLHPKNERFQKLAKNIFWAGFAISAISLSTNPSTLNIVIASIYGLLALGRLTILKPRALGRLTLAHEPLPYARIEAYSAAAPDVLVAKAVADAMGRYYLLANPGQYIIKVSKKTDSGYEPVYTSSLPVMIKKGVLNRDFLNLG